MHVVHLSHHGPVAACLTEAVARAAADALRQLYPSERAWTEVARGRELGNLELLRTEEEARVVTAHRAVLHRGHLAVKSRLALAGLVWNHVRGAPGGLIAEALTPERAEALVRDAERTGIAVTGAAAPEFMR